MIIITANSTAMSSYVLHMTWERIAVALFIFFYACSGYIWGLLVARLLHQPQPTLVTMSFACGLRNISSGAVIASQYFPGEVVFPVMCGTLFQQMLAAFFGALIHRLYDEDASTTGRQKRSRRCIKLAHQVTPADARHRVQALSRHCIAPSDSLQNRARPPSAEAL